MNPFAIDFGEPIMAVQCGATADDDPVDFEVAKRQTHDNLINQHPVRLGPVHWLVSDNTEADQICDELGGPYAAGGEGASLRDFCQENPLGKFIVAMVAVPAGIQ